MISNYRYALITKKLLLKNIMNTNNQNIMNKNIRIYGIHNKNMILNYKFPRTHDLLFDYCTNDFIYKNLNIDTFPSLKNIYFANCDCIDFSLINYPFESQNIYNDRLDKSYYDKFLNINMHKTSSTNIYNLWNDDGFELPK